MGSIMTSNFDSEPAGFRPLSSDRRLFAPLGAHPLMVVSLAIIVALALGTIAYLTRPTAEAGIVIEIGDGALGELVSKAVPGFPYDPPSAEGVAAWLRDQAVKTNALGDDERRIVTARGQRLYITTYGRDRYQAIELAEALAEKAVNHLAIYRPKLQEDLIDWIEQAPSDDDERLAARFEVALTEEMERVQEQLAASTQQTQDISEPANNEGKQVYQGLIMELDRLIAEIDHLRKRRVNPDTVNVELASSSEEFEARKNVLFSSKAWAVPVSRVIEPARLSPRPLHYQPFVQIVGILLLALVASILATLLYHRYRPNGRVEPNPELFADPYWPGPVRSLTD